MAILSRSYPDRLLEAAELDVGGQFLHTLQTVKVARVRIQQVDVDVRDLIRAGARIGHIGRLQRLGETADIERFWHTQPSLPMYSATHLR